MKKKKIPAKNKKLFEKNYSAIKKSIESKAHRWTFYADAAISWEDIVQKLMFHVFKKIHLWRPERGPIEPWLNILLSNQMINNLRDMYSGFANPSRNCSCFFCSQGLETECIKYKEWIKHKKNKSDIKLTLPLEHHKQEIYEKPSQDLDYNKIHKDIIIKIKSMLSYFEYRIYRLAFIKQMEDEEIVKYMKLRESGQNLNTAVRKVVVIRKKIIDLVREILKNDGY
ncbi:MAG: sigma factor [Nanoarchaeota archaeon]